MRKLTAYLTVLMLFCGLQAFCQRPLFKYAQSYSFQDINGEPLALGLAGGLNAPLFSTIDLDGDGTDELFVFDRTADRILTFARVNNAWVYAPDYEQEFPGDIRYWAILRDMNCDGRKDLVTGAGFGIDVYLNFSDGLGGIEWQQLRTLSSVTPNGDFVIPASSSDLPAIEDIDGDGDLDILVFDFSTGNQINYNRNMSVETYGDCSAFIFERVTRSWGGIHECNCGSLAFGEACPPDSGRQGSKLQHAGGKSLTLVDYDNDGDKDLLMGDETCEVFYFLENKGTPETAVMDSYTTDYPAGVPARPGLLPTGFVEDFNNDGRQDLIVASGLPRRVEQNADYTRSSWYYRQTDSGLELRSRAFLQEDMVDVGMSSTILFADVDRDGDKDLLVSTFGQDMDSSFASAIYLYEYEDDTYRLTDKDFLGFSALNKRNLKLGLGRVDDDEFEDLVFMASNINSYATELYYIPASGDTFSFNPTQARILNAEAGFNTGFTLEDVNGDGLDDLLMGRQFGSLMYYVNNGGTFTLSDDAFLGIDDDASRANPHAIFADFNNNGTRDMVVADFRGVLYFYSDYRNFNPRINIAAPLEYANNSFEPELVRTDNRTWLAVAESGDFPSIMMATARGGIAYLANRSMGEMPTLNTDPLEVSVYPNPSQFNYVRLKASRTCIVDVFDTSGREVRGDFKLDQNTEYTLELDELPRGMYIVRARTNSELSVQKFLKYE
ncbi:MAG: T9SS type A sorting domain-containing protein [Cyclobacteriaceae bacterium]